MNASGGSIIPPDAVAASTVSPGEYSYPRMVGYLWGNPVFLTTSVPITETKGSSSAATHIIYGDFSRAAVPYRPVVELSRLGVDDMTSLGLSDQLLFANDQIALLATMRATIVLSQPLGFSVATGIL